MAPLVDVDTDVGMVGDAANTLPARRPAARLASNKLDASAMDSYSARVQRFEHEKNGSSRKKEPEPEPEPERKRKRNQQQENRFKSKRCR